MKVEDIKFKAKSILDGAWVQGDLVHKEDGAICILRNGFNVSEVDPSTVCQFTGLRDTNDVPIFEGDIINFGGEGEVVFKDGAFSVKFGKYTECLLSSLVKSKESIKVVGSKFDRKEGKE